MNMKMKRAMVAMERKTIMKMSLMREIDSVDERMMMSGNKLAPIW